MYIWKCVCQLELIVSQSVSPCYLGKSHVLSLWPPGSLVSASQVLGSHIGSTYLPSFYVGSGHPILVHMLAGKCWLTIPPQLPTFLKYYILVSWGLQIVLNYLWHCSWPCFVSFLPHTFNSLNYIPFSIYVTSSITEGYDVACKNHCFLYIEKWSSY